MLRARHLPEDRLFDGYLAERAGDPLDPRVAEHLADCDACAHRYSELMSMMDELAAQATADCDAVFTPDRLRAQQQQIARRLELIGRPARVISFPRAFATGRTGPPAAHRPQRWIAAAAAAGLFIGVALGVSLQWQRHAQSASSLTAARPAPAYPARIAPAVPVATDGRTGPPQVAADDAFLSDLDLLLERPRTRELLAFDTFTPHVREVSTIR